MNPVFFYIPNLIGYLRVISGILAFYYSSFPLVFASLYTVSMALDALDGVAARYFNQCSQFGVLLDMLTDRMTSACLMLLLGELFSEWNAFWKAMVMLDLVSHWVVMYAGLITKAASHKTHTNPILAFYYGFPTLFLTCLGNEAFFVSLYLCYFVKQDWIDMLVSVCFPIFVFKQITNIVQFMDASSRLASLDVPKKTK